MIILLYGPNEYLLRKKLQEIINHYQQKHQGLDLNRVDAEQLDFKDFWYNFRQKSMFVSRRLTIVDNVFQNTDFKKKFNKNLEILANDEEVIVASAIMEIKKTDQALVKKIKKYGRVQEFPKPSKSETSDWLVDLNHIHNLGLSPESIQAIGDHIENDWNKGWETARRLSVSEDQSIAIRDILRLDQEIQKVDIFKLSAAISQGKKKEALVLMHRYFAQGGRPEGLLPLIIYQFRQLIIVRDLIDRGLNYREAQKASGLVAFIFNRVYNQAEQMDMDYLRGLYQKIFKLDYQLKTGRIEPRTGLDLLVSQI